MPWLTAGVLIVFTPIAIVRLLAARGSTPLAWPVIGILSMALVGTAVSPDRAVSLQKLAGIVLGALALAAVQARGRSAGGFAAAMIVFVALATVAVAAAGAAALLPAVRGCCRRARRCSGPCRRRHRAPERRGGTHPPGCAGAAVVVGVPRGVGPHRDARSGRATAHAGHGRPCFASAPRRSASRCW